MILLLTVPLAARGEQGVYIVKQGDTLFRIARIHSIPVNVLKAVNRLDNPSSLAVGDKIRIPAVHTVKKGDTLYSLGRRYGVSVADLRHINRLSSSQSLKINQKLYFFSTMASASVRKSAKTEPSHQTKSTVFWPHPGLREVYSGKMRGIVITGQRADLVYSVSLGRVIWAGPYRGFGNVVLVSGANELVYGYMGLEEVIVSVGEQIESGSAVGRMGMYFHQTDAKLLFIIFDNSRRVYLDPRAVLLASSQVKEKKY
jgi:murein DD-endopeptidase MepM/ murein hydrolase activator NlpD